MTLQEIPIRIVYDPPRGCRVIVQADQHSGPLIVGGERWTAGWTTAGLSLHYAERFRTDLTAALAGGARLIDGD